MQYEDVTLSVKRQPWQKKWKHQEGERGRAHPFLLPSKACQQVHTKAPALHYPLQYKSALMHLYKQRLYIYVDSTFSWFYTQFNYHMRSNNNCISFCLCQFYGNNTLPLMKQAPASMHADKRYSIKSDHLRQRGTKCLLLFTHLDSVSAVKQAKVS